MQQAQLERSSNRSGSGSNNGGGAQPRPPLSLKDLGLRLAGLLVIDAVASWFALTLLSDNIPIAAVVLVIVTIGVNWIFLSDRLYPLRWLTPGVLLLILMVVYPLIYTIYSSFTNYSDAHRLSKEQAVAQLETQTYQSKGAATYSWTAYRNPAGKFKIILQNKATNKSFIGDENGLTSYVAPPTLPTTLEGGYQKLTPFQAAAAGNQIQALNLKDSATKVAIQITSSTEAQELRPKYTYDAATDKLTDQENNIVYTPVKGTFTSPDGKELQPGFTAVVGGENYGRIFSDSNITQPFVGVFLWTIIFAAMSVVLTFAFGLAMALVLNDPQLPLKTLFRSLIFIPYTIPSFISALVWAGLFSIIGPVGIFSKSVFGEAFSWQSDPNWAKVMLLFINTWLGYPYMMLISLGALQSIPLDMFEAAILDGATAIQKFWNLTLPLLLVSVAPLLISSFAFNFNNFGLIELVTKGGPPDPTTTTPAGQTDILISYTYRLAFASGKGSDLGLASTISFFIFLIVAGITIFNFRFTKRLEEVF